MKRNVVLRTVLSRISNSNNSLLRNEFYDEDFDRPKDDVELTENSQNSLSFDLDADKSCCIKSNNFLKEKRYASAKFMQCFCKERT